MKLIEVNTFHLVDVIDETVEEYAILSHQWEEGEVSFQDMQNLDIATSNKGFAKIRRTCEHAKYRTSNTHGSTFAALIKKVVRSSVRRSTPCTIGTGSQGFVLCFCLMLIQRKAALC